jgi:hypothetical protein
LAALFQGWLPGRPQPGQPETVMVTFHAEAEADLARVLERHWDTARRLNLVLDAPRASVRGTANARTCFVDIFT